MSSKLTSVLVFAAGVAIGSAVTWGLLKTKYERIAQEEIDSVKEVFSRKSNREKEIDQETEVDMSEYKEVIRTANYHPEVTRKDEVKSANKSHPYVIPPEEYGEGDGYGMMELTYYADGVLADDWYEVIDDVDDMVGEESLTHFGEYEEDSVYVRNDDRRMEYQILLDSRRYADIKMLVPHPEDE